MTTYTGAVFNNGAVARLVDVAVAAAGRTPFADELARFNRTLADSPTANWAMPSATLSALLDLIAQELETRPETPLPQGFAERLAAAAGSRGGPRFLKDTARALREGQRRGIPRFDELPMSPWEAELRFSGLRDFSWWVESDEYDSFEEGVVAGVTSEHPDGCAFLLPRLAQELHTALLIGADTESGMSLRAVVPWATPPVLSEILRVASAHLLEAH
ncbi:hypothetical protein [Streptomyces sp. NPDC059165]|uniref:hypothetical protein n=1 Tax=Streptomyces sp. NPDC059165 TaxID=3346751 RepID=UPI0036A087D4